MRSPLKISILIYNDKSLSIVFQVLCFFNMQSGLENIYHIYGIVFAFWQTYIWTEDLIQHLSNQFLCNALI